MLTLTTPDGTTIIGESHVHLATLWADHLHGPSWDDHTSPFDEHTTIWDLIEEICEIEDVNIPGYRVDQA